MGKGKQAESAPPRAHILDQQYEMVGVGQLRSHPRNPRQGDVGAIIGSIEANGFYGAIIVQRSTGYVIAGNHRLKAARESGVSEVPVLWLDVDDDRALRIMLADNRTNDLASYDDNILADILKELAEGSSGGLSGTGYDGDDFDLLIQDLNQTPPAAPENYARGVDIPIYVPTSDSPPPVSSLADESKALELIKAIEATSNLSPKMKRFLTLAAYRHVVFDHALIAEFYSHAPPEVQSLFEQSALVIIDFNNAIERGFVKLVNSLEDIYSMEPVEEPEDPEEDLIA